MHPDKENTVTINPKLLVEEPEVMIANEAMTPADKLENSTIISMLLALMGFSYIIYYFVNGGTLDLNIVNAIFLFLGVALHRTPKRFVGAITDAAKGAAGIILQFPFYAGIMGMMVGTSAAGISLAGVMSTSFVSISNQHTFPLFTFLSAGLVNFFIPSGGGQWAVQAPIACRCSFRCACCENRYGYCLEGCMD